MRNIPQGTLIPGHQPMALESPRAGLLFARAARRLAAAAILVGLSTLCFAPAAFAQTQLWTGTREVQQVNSSIVGCSNGVPTAPCTDTSIRTDDDFTDTGTGYPFDGIFIRSSGRLELQFTSDLTAASDAFTCHVGSTTFEVATADSMGARVRAWLNSGLIWSVGDDITLKRTQRASNNPATGDPTIAGTARVGQTLTAAKGTIDDDDGLTKADDGDTGYAYTYQWVRVDGTDEEEITDADSSTYTLVVDDLGKTAKVEVSFTDETRPSASYREYKKRTA